MKVKKYFESFISWRLSFVCVLPLLIKHVCTYDKHGINLRKVFLTKFSVFFLGTYLPKAVSYMYYYLTKVCGDGFMDFIHRPKSKILKILKN
jgi:hypothetical protein